MCRRRAGSSGLAREEPAKIFEPLLAIVQKTTEVLGVRRPYMIAAKTDQLAVQLLALLSFDAFLQDQDPRKIIERPKCIHNEGLNRHLRFGDLVLVRDIFSLGRKDRENPIDGPDEHIEPPTKSPSGVFSAAVGLVLARVKFARRSENFL